MNEGASFFFTLGGRHAAAQPRDRAGSSLL
jgi:hypothetical protein